ncbi:acyl carrier protein [Actinophytocola xanthii]|uniref:acyl carrier protein n=1 Tax=Actinophytocola xanthii TaxID=1912961 RepID=UPI0009F94F90|nr:acyl carrier protein [Actinophytocola xanthii]
MSTRAASSPAARFVLTISGSSAESLFAYVQKLSAVLSDDPRSGRHPFPRAVTFAGVAATLLNFRRCAPHRLAFTAASLAEAADKLLSFTEHTSNPEAAAPQGLYVNVIHRSTFDGAVETQDRDYLRALAASARHDQLAKLWSVGFPVDWRHVYPELIAERPIWLPPAPLNRRRYWPEAPGAASATTTPAAAPPEVDLAEQDPSVDVARPGNRTSQLVAELKGLPTTLRERRLCDYLQDRIAVVLDYPEGERPRTDLGFFDLGMSSIHLGQVRQSIVADTAFEPSETSAFDHPTIVEFAAYLARELAANGEPDIAAAASVAQEVATAATQPGRALLPYTLGEDEIDRLSAHDLERALIEVVS